MSLYRTNLPQLSGDLFLADAGLETDLIFNNGIDIPEFAAHTLLSDPEGLHIVWCQYHGPGWPGNWAAMTTGSSGTSSAGIRD